MRNLPGSTSDVYGRFKLEMHAKQRVESVNCSNDTVFLTHVYLSFLQPNKAFYLLKRRLFRRHIVYHLYWLQPIKLVKPVRLHTGAVYME